MLSQSGLHQFLENSAQHHPDKIAIEDPGHGAITYQELNRLSDKVRNRLVQRGVGPGVRVGIYLSKSIDSVAAIMGTLKTGAAYVPVDPGAPPSRNAYILNDCGVTVIIVEDQFEDELKTEMRKQGDLPTIITLRGAGGGGPLSQALQRADQESAAPETRSIVPSPDELAYILYTSGSTGKPKGVMISHRAAISFVDWCSEALSPIESDRFSSHAPFHFDLSILDIYVPLKHGAAVVLIGEQVGKEPAGLAQLIADRKITSWYSTPSILSLLVQYGKLERHDYSALRTVLFAGEVFPIKHLRALKALIPDPRYFNLYGPTETNVCTYYEIPERIPDDRGSPYPIGQACSHYNIIVVDQDGNEVPTGEEGELWASGPGVMDGYWNLPSRSAQAFSDDGEARWYKTGDIVVEASDGNYIFIGRRDRMVKKRGYRIELGEIEVGLYRHPAIKEAAVIALADEENGVRIKAFICCHDDKRPSLIEMKRFCAQNLPIYMIPDLFSFQDVLPKTSTDKINYQQLKTMV